MFADGYDQSVPNFIPKRRDCADNDDKNSQSSMDSEKCNNSIGNNEYEEDNSIEKLYNLFYKDLNKFLISTDDPDLVYGDDN